MPCCSASDAILERRKVTNAGSEEGMSDSAHVSEAAGDGRARDEDETVGEVKQRSRRARLGHLALLWLGPLLVAGVSAWLWLHGGRFVTTDNAYLKADIVSVSSEISGRVMEVLVRDHARVTYGQLLFRVDDRPYRIALARAEAKLERVRGDIESLKAEYLNKRADLEKSGADLEYYRREYERLARLRGGEAVSAAQVDQADHAVQQALKEMEVARQSLRAVKARLIDPLLPVEQHPDFLLASAELEQARLDLAHTRTHAPSNGVVARLEVRPGEYVAAGVPLFSIVDDSHLWVEANFKETDLTWLREGQDAVVKVDTFPGREWRARVLSINPGTGSEFSLLPAQNSSGNWVKVVQRIAVKLELDAAGASDAALRAGMSTVVEVDTGHSRRLPWLKGS